MKNVDWNQFRSSLGERLRNWHIPRTLTRADLDAHVRFLITAINDSCAQFSKLVLVRPRDPVINLWYTEELAQERKSVAALGRRAVRTKEEADWTVFHAAQREYSSNLRRAARACFHKFATDPSIDGRDQSQPQARQPRRQQWHGDHQPLQSPLIGILPHDVPV